MKPIIDFVIAHLFKVELWLILAAWFSAFAGAVIYYVWQHPSKNKSIIDFFKYTFPRELIYHPSCRRDIIFAAVNRVFEPIAISSLLIATSGTSIAIYYALSSVFGIHENTEFNFVIWLIMIFVVLMIQDFCTWYSHYLEHKIPALWEIHKVHHSAEFLNLLSNRRHHPLQLVWEGGLSNLSAGIALGVISYTMHISILDNVLLGVDAYFLGNILSFYQLRHSHIPLHYGRFEKWFLSPANHQLHHSVELGDWDINFGLFTSVWDRIFGTLKLSQPGYKFRIGLQPQYQSQYNKWWKLYTTPIINLAVMGYKKIKLVPLDMIALFTRNNRLP